MPNTELRAIPGVWGHFAGGGANRPTRTASTKGLRHLPTA
jgi:hypothetical protein